MNNSNRVERVNCALMVAACAFAFAAPFHLFLAAYAILGPLHYLTQISWMHDRHYFAPRPAARRWWLMLVGLAMTVFAKLLQTSSRSEINRSTAATRCSTFEIASTAS